MAEMLRPEPYEDGDYDYLKCVTYLQNKYDFVERNIEEDQDFWFFAICQKADARNGDSFKFNEWWFADAEAWQKKIGNYFFEEFGVGEIGERQIPFIVSW